MAGISRKLRMGMVGGGPGAFIGEVHRKAARLDGQIELVAGAFDVDPRKSKKKGRELFLPARRIYGTYEDMIDGESTLPADERIDFVAVCTPNKWHYPIARAFLEAGFHVVCEKPMTMDVREAKALRDTVRRTRRVFALMHNYTAFPMVKLARDLVRGGELGRILKVVVKYPQDWLARAIEREGQMQAAWRSDPKQAGAAGCMGDIGTHAANLAEYVTGLRIQELCAELTRFVKDRRLEDDGNCLLRFNQGARGVLIASQVSIGHQNDIGLQVYGENGAIEWHEEHPEELYVKRLNAPIEIWRRGNGYVADRSPAAARATRLPAGHPEAFIEAFANVYANFADTLRCRLTRTRPDPLMTDFPDVDDGLRGMQFIAAVVKSAKLGAKWVKIGK